MQQTSSEMLQCLLKDFSTVARLIHFAAWVLLSKSRAPLHCGVFFPSVTAESVRVQWSSRHQLLSKWMLGREGRGVLFVSPLATPPASHVVPAAAPASLCLPVWIQHVHISWISNNDTASPIFCHVITPSPSCLSSSLRLFTLTAGNLASLIHSLYAAFFIRHRLNSGNPTTLLWFPTYALKYYSLLLLIILKNVSVLFSFNILWCAFFSPLIWLSFLGSVVMRTTLSPPLSLSPSPTHFFLAQTKITALKRSSHMLFLWSVTAQWGFVENCSGWIRCLTCDITKQYTMGLQKLEWQTYYELCSCCKWCKCKCNVNFSPAVTP